MAGIGAGRWRPYSRTTAARIAVPPATCRPDRRPLSRLKPRHPFQNILFRAIFLVGLAALACNLPRRDAQDNSSPATIAPTVTPAITLTPTASPTPPAPRWCTGCGDNAILA